RAVDAAVDIGAFEVQDFVVTTTIDIEVVGTLRSAIIGADVAGGSTITFAPGLSGTIVLRDALPEIRRSVQVLGPGANVVTVQRSTDQFTPDFRIFTVDGPTGGIVDVTVTLSGLTIANGQAPGLASGGGILNAGTLTVANCVLAGSSAFLGGGIDN